MNYPELIKDILRFRDQIKIYKKYNNTFYNLSLCAFFNKWRFFRLQTDSLNFGIPWISFPAIKYIDKYLSKEMSVFEFGSGGSTLFFSERAREVISIEHDDQWYRKMCKTIENKGLKNIKLIMEIPTETIGLEDLYSSENEEYRNKSFKNYVSTLDSFPNNYFSLVLIDGRARQSCFKHSLDKIKKGGLIVFDNTERTRYRQVFNLANKNFIMMEFPGPTPFSKTFTITTIFLRIL